MIIRNNCFETNSSSTHALCIGQGKYLKTPFELLNDYNSNRLDYENYEKNYTEDLLPIINEKEFNKYLDKALNDYENKDRYLVLSRYRNIGREFKEYKYFPEKLNFIWTTLIYYYKYKDSDWFKNNINTSNIYMDRLLKNFIGRLADSRFKFYCTDIEFVKDIVNETKYNEPTELGLINMNTAYPATWRNKHMKGLETFGYYPLEEIGEIIDDPLLFWNLLLGESIIYTGSDETGSFDNLDFSTYKIHFVGGSDYGTNLDINCFKYKLPTLIGSYINGNYETKIYSDGTRTRELVPYNQYYNNNGLYKFEKYEIDEIDLMNPEFPESIDLKITDYCNNNCEFCYTNSSIHGKHADKLFLKNIISQMKPYTEIAIGGGNPLEHPDLIEILEYAKEKKVICNMTIKDVDAIKYNELINSLYENNLIYSFGISPSNIETIKQFKQQCTIRFDFILHLILGIHSLNFIHEIEKEYFNKILILGYKDKGKGTKYFQDNKDVIEKNIEEVSNYILKCNTEFKVNTIAFDNLAIEQLNLDEYTNFDMYYQGKDGKFSFYINAVEQTYAKSSLDEGDTFGHRDLDLLYYFKNYIKED